jgi:hypothetical protein
LRRWSRKQLKSASAISRLRDWDIFFVHSCTFIANPLKSCHMRLRKTIDQPWQPIFRNKIGSFRACRSISSTDMTEEGNIFGSWIQKNPKIWRNYFRWSFKPTKAYLVCFSVIAYTPNSNRLSRFFNIFSNVQNAARRKCSLCKYSISSGMEEIKSGKQGTSLTFLSKLASNSARIWGSSFSALSRLFGHVWFR